MPPDAALARLLAGLQKAHGDAIIIDDETWPAARLLALADKIAGACGKAQRLACLSDHPAVIAASLLAAQRNGNDLLLVRDPRAANETLLDQLGIAGTIDGEGKVSPRTSEVQVGSGLVLLMTSGTTGSPKIAAHRLTALMERIPDAPAADASACWLLTYHPASFAGLQVLLTALTSGTTLIATMHSGITALVSIARKQNVSYASGTPTFWRGFLTACANDAKQIPFCIITLGGEMADQPTLDRLRATWPKAKLVHIYASTEGGAVFAVKDGRAGFPATWLRSGIDGYQLRLKDGMLELKGPRVMERYEGAIVSPLADGWLKTGDLCAAEGDRVAFAGRQDSLINVGGAKVSPEAVEAALLRLPLVRDARVFGRKNPITGMLVAAEIVLADNSEDQTAARKAVLDHARAVLQPFEVPQILTFVPSLTATAAAKKVRQ